MDQFVWDADEPLNNAEMFAQQTCADLGLGGEFAATIAHAIREQLYSDRKVGESVVAEGKSFGCPGVCVGGECA